MAIKIAREKSELRNIKECKLMKWRRRHKLASFFAIMSLLIELSVFSATSSLVLLNKSQDNTSDNEAQRRGAASSKIRRHAQVATLQDEHFAPKLMHQPASELVPQDGPHTVECPVEANPTAEVKWFKDNQLFVSQAPHSDQTGNELMFIRMNDEDTGDYHCEATNYLGSVASEHFRLTVNSSVYASTISLAPRLAEVGADQQAEFTCTIQGLREQQQRSKLEPELNWHRNGRKLLVKWLPEGEELLDSRSKFVARQGSQVGEYVLSITRVSVKDDNSTFTCLYRFQGSQVNDSSLWRESNKALLRVYSDFSQQQNLDVTTTHVKLDVNLAPPIDNLVGNNLHQLATNNHHQNNTTHLIEQQQNVNTLKVTLLDLFEMAKPTLIIFGILFVVSLFVLLQLIYIRRRSRQNRYMKHTHYASSGASGTSGSGASGGPMVVDCVDPVLSSLMGRTLSVPTCSLSGAGKKFGYRSYRDHMRKVAAANSDIMVTNDFLDANYIQHQQHLNHPHNSTNEEPFFMGSAALPNLYNQSLAAREQARSLLQTSEHMRSLSNLNHNVPAQQQHLSRQNGSHLNLPLSYAFKPALNTLVNNRIPDNQQILNAGALWPQNSNGFQLTNNNNTRNSDEHYQLVNCSSISPSSSSSMAGSSNSSGCNTRDNQLRNKAQAFPKESNASSNHYSTIDANDEDDGRYEEVEGCKLFNQQQSTSATGNNQPVKQAGSKHDSFRRVSRTSTFVVREQQEAGEQEGSKINHEQPTLVNDAFSRFGSKRNSRQMNNKTLNQQERNRQNFQDQLSPYAVSSICQTNIQSKTQPPPVNSEAMRALCEQFDINQLMLLEDSNSIRPSLPFEAPPPPPPDCAPQITDKAGASSEGSH